MAESLTVNLQCEIISAISMEDGREVYQPEQVIPLELEGLDKASFSESWGGNAGQDRAIVNANYRSGKFVYQDDPDFQVGNPSVSFRIRSIPYELKIALKEKGLIRPPALIDTVSVDPGVGQKEEYFRQRALQR
jgi:hypothetical protein